MHTRFLIRPENNKALMILLVLCCFSKFAFSQDVYSNKESSAYSFTIGLTSSNLYNDTIKYATGILLNAGFVYTVTFSDRINAGIELLYTGKAIKKDNPTIKYRFGYLDIPLYLQYKFSDNIKADFGLQYSKYINSQLSYLDGSKSTGVHLQSFSSNNDSDLAIMLGAEFGIKKEISISPRYILSSKSFLTKSTSYFGVFQLSFKIIMHRSYKQLFKKSLNPDSHN